jgi:SAM-dependent methyltransferase
LGVETQISQAVQNPIKSNPPAAGSFLGSSARRSLSLEEVHADIESYYALRVARYGATPLGVDWSCVATQQLRFVQLLKICNFRLPFSINDLGCGYGALLDFIYERYPGSEVNYLGIDLSATMIRRARRRHQARPGQRFVVGSVSPRVADYSVASGILNVKLQYSVKEWEDYVAQVLRAMCKTSRRAFAVNFMAAVPLYKPTDQLYRTDPDRWLQFCHGELGCSVEFISGYGMREFTLLARRDETAGAAKEANSQSVSVRRE